MILHPVWPTPGHSIDTDAPFARQKIAEFYPLPAGDHSLRANLVSTVDGGVRGADGTSKTLTGGADRAVLSAIRATSDVVLVGGATLRAEPDLLPRATPLAVVSRSGDLGGVTARAGRDHGPIYVFAPAAAGDRVTASMNVAHTFVPTQAEPGVGAFLPSVLVELAGRGMHHVVCEGGPSLVRALIHLQLIDEFCLTVAPQFAAPGTPDILDGRLDRPLPAPLVGMLADDAGYLYTRRRLR